MVVNVPIFDIAGKAHLAEARKRKMQSLIELKRTEVTLLSAFDTALRDIANQANLNWEQIATALKREGRLHLETY